VTIRRRADMDTTFGIVLFLRHPANATIGLVSDEPCSPCRQARSRKTNFFEWCCRGEGGGLLLDILLRSALGMIIQQLNEIGHFDRSPLKK
jgi:hypothetical protein